MKVKGARSWGYLKTHKSQKGDRYYAYVLGDDHKYHSVGVFASKEEAEYKLNRTKSEIKADMWTPTPTREEKHKAKLSFDEYALKYTYEQEIRATTRRGYLQLLQNYLIPFFGSKAISKITKDNCKEFYNSLDKSKHHTVTHCMIRLKSIFYQAIEDGIITENPAKGIKIKKPEYNPRIAVSSALLDKNEINTLIEATAPKYRLITVLGAYCGTRIGEALALTPKDINKNDHTLSISKSVNHRGGKAHITKPKTPNSNRIIHIPPEAWHWVVEHLENYSGENYLFERTDKQPMSRSKWNDKYFSQARLAIKRPKFRYHDLRHTCMTHYSRQGATIRDVMAIAGHSTPDMAIIYQETSSERLSELAQKLSYN
jgi:integrase